MLHKPFRNDTLEQAVNFMLAKSESKQPRKKFPAHNNFVIKVVIPVLFIGMVLFTIWYMANHPNL